MRKFLPLLLLVFAYPANATIALVQKRSVTYSNTSSPQSLAFSTNTTAGNTIVGMCGAFDNNGGVIPVLYDGLGAHFTGVVQNGDSFTFRAATAVYPNIAGGASTITCTSDVNGRFFTIIIAEYSGVDPNFPVDAAAVNSAYSTSGSTKSAGSITTTQANEVICAFYYDDHIPGGVNFSATINSGLTIQEQTSTFGTNTQGGFADLIVSSIQTGFNPTWSDATWATDGVVLMIVPLVQSFSTTPPIFIQQSDNNTASGTAVSKAFSSPQTATDMNFIHCFGAQAGVPVLSIADTNVNSYTLIDNIDNAVNSASYWWYAKNIASGSNTVTCTSNVSSTSMHLEIVEYRGISNTVALDQHSAVYHPNSGAVAINQANAITTTSANEIVLLSESVAEAAGLVRNNLGPANFTNRIWSPVDGVSAQALYISDMYVTSTGTYTPWSFAAAGGPYFQLTASFILAPASTGVRHRAQVIRHRSKKRRNAPILTASL